MSLSASVAVLETPVKSENDKKSYRLIRLPNGLKVLLISTPSNKTGDNASAELSSKLAACAVCVDVGSFSDPLNIPGMAHFLGNFKSSTHRMFLSFRKRQFLLLFPYLEHLIFLGSEKYPNENGFEQFMQKSGGFCNANTDSEETTYYFRVREQFLNEGLERFSNLIQAPLLQKNSMLREREAVDSEYSAKKNSEGSRQHQLMASLSHESHPFRKFNCGNLKTLKTNVDDDSLYDQVHEFKRHHYSAHRMYVCVQSKESLDKLQVELIEKRLISHFYRVNVCEIRSKCFFSFRK